MVDIHSTNTYSKENNFICLHASFLLSPLRQMYLLQKFEKKLPDSRLRVWSGFFLRFYGLKPKSMVFIIQNDFFEKKKI